MSQDRWEKSRAWLERAEKVMPGGVNSPVRAFRSVGGHPPFICKAKGAYMWDEDGNRYIDYINSWGPLIMGHANDSVLAAIHEAAQLGTSYGAPTSAEVLMAEKIQTFFPSIEVVRLVSSGTEATMSVIRLARAATQRPKIIKCSGCYHGHGDSFLIAAGSGAMTFGVPNSPGVTKETASNTILVPYNSVEAVEQAFAENPGQIAGIILEPVPGNMGLIEPKEGYLQGLRDVTQKNDALLIFDEVMTGFRVAPGGVQELFGVTPDLTTLGKVIGGGLPMGAYGGRRDLMSMISPSGPVYQAGTLSGNPLAVAAGMATLNLLSDTDTFEVAAQRTQELVDGLQTILSELSLEYTLTRYGTMCCLFFHPGPVVDYESAQQSNTEAFGRYFRAMLERGVHLPPSQFEANFVSAAHTSEDIQTTLQASREALQVAHS
ncbi:MAG: glutamate-1-semialdehyde-2,1-aminomutase [Deltaproteobacteria bacterium]|nr:MAG: glutamate-1-semialdehyde-2,1-aminomutase [Deltaproteobacteria bacterium]